MVIEKLYVKKDGESEFEIHDRVDGIYAMGITKVAPQLTPNVHQIVGTDGEIDYGAYYGPSTVTVKVYLDGHDVYDYKMLVSELYKALYSRKPIRIHDEVEPYICYNVFVQPMTLTTINFTQGTATITFTNPSGFRQSIETCDKLLGTSYQFGMNQTNNDLIHGDIKYQFNSDNFWIYNDSDVTIDPYVNRHQLKITLNCDGKPTIKNLTTNTSISVTQNISSSQTFMLNGVDSFLDSSDYGVNTDMGYITIAPGWNNFEVDGASNININFSFPFLYL